MCARVSRVSDKVGSQYGICKRRELGEVFLEGPARLHHQANHYGERADGGHLTLLTLACAAQRLRKPRQLRRTVLCYGCQDLVRCQLQIRVLFDSQGCQMISTTQHDLVCTAPLVQPCSTVANKSGFRCVPPCSLQKHD